MGYELHKQWWKRDGKKKASRADANSRPLKGAQTAPLRRTLRSKNAQGAPIDNALGSAVFMTPAANPIRTRV